MSIHLEIEKLKDHEFCQIFGIIRYQLNERGLMEYNSDTRHSFGDDLFIKLCECEVILQERVAAKHD